EAVSISLPSSSRRETSKKLLHSSSSSTTSGSPMTSLVFFIRLNLFLIVLQ
ncbi:unnamed protein product, partial [Arabidopsis halleri]